MEVQDFNEFGFVREYDSHDGIEAFLLVLGEGFFDLNSFSMSPEKKELIDVLASHEKANDQTVTVTTGGESYKAKSLTKKSDFRGWVIADVEKVRSHDLAGPATHIRFARVKPSVGLKTIRSHAPDAYKDVEGFGSW